MSNNYVLIAFGIISVLQVVLFVWTIRLLGKLKETDDKNLVRRIEELEDTVKHLISIEGVIKRTGEGENNIHIHLK